MALSVSLSEQDCLVKARDKQTVNRANFKAVMRKGPTCQVFEVVKILGWPKSSFVSMTFLATSITWDTRGQVACLELSSLPGGSGQICATYRTLSPTPGHIPG